MACNVSAELTRCFTPGLVINIVSCCCLGLVVCAVVAATAESEWERRWNITPPAKAVQKDIESLQWGVHKLSENLEYVMDMCTATLAETDNTEELALAVGVMSNILSSVEGLTACYGFRGTRYAIVSQQVSGWVAESPTGRVFRVINSAAGSNSTAELLSSRTAFASLPAHSYANATLSVASPLGGILVSPKIFFADSLRTISQLVSADVHLFYVSNGVEHHLNESIDHGGVSCNADVSSGVGDQSLCLSLRYVARHVRAPFRRLFTANNAPATLCAVVVYLLLIIGLAKLSVLVLVREVIKELKTLFEFPDVYEENRIAGPEQQECLLSNPGDTEVASVMTALHHLLSELNTLKPYIPGNAVYGSCDIAHCTLNEDSSQSTLCNLGRVRSSEAHFGSIIRSDSVASCKAMESLKARGRLKANNLCVQESTAVITISVQHQLAFWMKSKDLSSFEALQTSFIEKCYTAAQTHGGSMDSVTWDIIFMQFNTTARQCVDVYASSASAAVDVAVNDWNGSTLAPKISVGVAAGVSLCGQVGTKQRGYGVYSDIRWQSGQLVVLSSKHNVPVVCDESFQLNCETTHHCKPFAILASCEIKKDCFPDTTTILYEITGPIEEDPLEWMSSEPKVCVRGLTSAFQHLRSGRVHLALHYLEDYHAINPSDRNVAKHVETVKTRIDAHGEGPAYLLTEPLMVKTFWSCSKAEIVESAGNSEMTLASFLHPRAARKPIRVWVVAASFVVMSVVGCGMVVKWNDEVKEARTRIKVTEAAKVTSEQAWRLAEIAKRKNKVHDAEEFMKLFDEARTIAASLSEPSAYAVPEELVEDVIVADYDVMRPVAASPAYAYGRDPAFKYPEDTDTAFSTTSHLIVSYVPRAYFFPGFLSSADASLVISSVESKLQRSELAEYRTDKPGVDADNARTSKGAWLENTDAITKKIKGRVARLTGFRVENMEDVQVLKYETGERYLPHHDFFDPKLFGEMQSNRVATFYIFLSQDTSGGELALPMANDGPRPADFEKCNTGLRVKPRTGNAVLFYGMRPDRHLDPSSLHTGCKVKSGVKWSAVIWIRLDGKSYSASD